MLGFNRGFWHKKMEHFVPSEAEYPLDAQPRLIREAVECACVRHQLSPTLYASVAQAAASLAVQGLAVLKLPDGSTVPLSTYFLVIAMSGMGKTRAFYTFFAPFLASDRSIEEAYAKAVKEYPDKLSDYKKQRADLNKLIGKARAKGEPYDHLQTELNKLKRPDEPRLQKRLMSDTTGAAFLQRMRGFFQSAGLATDEGAKLFKYLYQFLADLCQAWSHGLIDSHRAEAGVTSAIEARIMTLILSQPAVFYDFCASHGSLALGMGAWARFLICAPRRPSGRLTSGNGLDATTAPLDAFLARITELIAEHERRAKAGITEQDIVELDADADDCLTQFIQEMKRRSVERNADGKAGDLMDVSEFSAKAPIHAARMAAVFTYLCGDMKVTRDTMQRAIDIIRFHIDAYSDQFSLSKAIPRVVEDGLRLETFFRRLYIETKGNTKVSLDSLHHNNTTSNLKLDKYLLPALIYMQRQGTIQMPPTNGGKPYVDFRPLINMIN
ncbi:DUF3987 domain-containing protein [Rhodanobacter terrae]|uniref:DUF3987 domain-containing protein n=1 Tax=Rhodanobacter terrae TaxID=418647 RepID=A0ABW0T2S4_9GAMM